VYEVLLGKWHIKKLIIEEEARINKFPLSHDQYPYPA